MIKVLFVCTGNICRSPTAEAVFRDLVRARGLEGRIGWDSAGTHAYHVGEPPDRRSQLVARKRGIDMADLRARKVVKADFADFDLILAMDRGHLEELHDLAPADARGRVRLFMDFADGYAHPDVPDPYYGGPDGFEHVLDMIEAGAKGILAHLIGPTT